ncbi:hypothetical protein [Amycolatopsis benzoatilytica]|uniref:hypothetical protein n=1 Tax=Amycolatopsis benzoatilytica TaxID=346045 RepID=UPI00039E0DEB|nr:hypothetical protein [Amycolatopsis benzoatilytica]
MLARIGGLFVFLGFGSLLLRLAKIEFRIIAWADDMQPVFGLVLGFAGLVLIGLQFVLAKRSKGNGENQFDHTAAAQGQFAQGQQFPPPGQPAQPGQYGQPGQFGAQPPYGQQAQFGGQPGQVPPPGQQFGQTQYPQQGGPQYPQQGGYPPAGGPRA